VQCLRLHGHAGDEVHRQGDAHACTWSPAHLETQEKGADNTPCRPVSDGPEGCVEAAAGRDHQSSPWTWGQGDAWLVQALLLPVRLRPVVVVDGWLIALSCLCRPPRHLWYFHSVFDLSRPPKSCSTGHGVADTALSTGMLRCHNVAEHDCIDSHVAVYPGTSTFSAMLLPICAGTASTQTSGARGPGRRRR
jgi:hypothetical protein